MTIERIAPAPDEDDRTMLRSWLDYQRATLATKCEGLDPEQLRTASVPPSPMSLLGIVRHLSDVERRWFRIGLANEDVPLQYNGSLEVTDSPDAAAVAEAFARWQEECGRAREIEASFASLDDQTHDPRRDMTLSVRWVMLHMVEEYARHNGHADLIRERIDGATGE